MKTNQLVVTRHPALVTYLIEKNIVSQDVEVIEHATYDLVKGKDVIGVLPHHLSCLANSITEVQLNIPAELRGIELSIEQVRECAGSICVYKVEKLDGKEDCFYIKDDFTMHVPEKFLEKNAENKNIKYRHDSFRKCCIRITNKSQTMDKIMKKLIAMGQYFNESYTYEDDHYFDKTGEMRLLEPKWVIVWGNGKFSLFDSHMNHAEEITLDAV